MKIKRYYNQDPAPSGGQPDGVVDAGIKAPEPAPAPIPGEEKKKAPTPTYDLSDLSKLKDFGDTPPEPQDKLKPENTDAKKPPAGEKTEVDEFTLDLEPESKTDNSQEPQETTWKQLSETIKLGELKEDSFEAFKESVDARLQSERLEGRKEGQNVTLEKWTDQQKELFDFLSVEGNTIEAFINPLQVYDKYLSMDNENLIREDYKLKGYEADKIDEIVEDMKIDNKIDTEAYHLKKALENGKVAKQQQMIVDARNKIQAKNQEIIDRELNELKSFTTKLHATKEFMGIPVSERSLAVIEGKFKDGFYRTRLANDPELAAEVALFIEFGKKSRELLAGELRDEGRQQLLKRVNNVGLPASGAGRVGGEEVVLKDFDAWEAKLREENQKRKTQG